MYNKIKLRVELRFHKTISIYGLKSGFFLKITKPSIIGVKGIYSSVASSALSPNARSTGVVCVWKPVIVFGLPAWPTTSTAYKITNGIK